MCVVVRFLFVMGVFVIVSLCYREGIIYRCLLGY